jgi:hypothetical protein
MKTAVILQFRQRPEHSRALTVIRKRKPEPRRLSSRLDVGIPSADTLFKVAVGILIGFVLHELRK